ncbi:MAG: hypothetical protein BMS9Abin17_1242 [Acidimicrobiia bacterium]|nr:MAG: hypothetical protein BMS9Abin17_1242 [Acidimicrobiia bacterium]
MTPETRPDGKPADPVAPWRAMLLAHNRAVRAIEADMASAGVIPLNLYDVLLELNGTPEGLRMQELGEQVVLSRTRVSRLVDDLEASGYVKRVSHPDDGRATLAQITARGHTALREAAPIYLEGINRHFSSHLSAAEQQSITRGLTRVVRFHDGPPLPTSH